MAVSADTGGHRKNQILAGTPTILLYTVTFLTAWGHLHKTTQPATAPLSYLCWVTHTQKLRRAELSLWCEGNQKCTDPESVLQRNSDGPCLSKGWGGCGQRKFPSPVERKGPQCWEEPRLLLCITRLHVIDSQWVWSSLAIVTVIQLQYPMKALMVLQVWPTLKLASLMLSAGVNFSYSFFLVFPPCPSLPSPVYALQNNAFPRSVLLCAWSHRTLRISDSIL